MEGLLKHLNTHGHLVDRHITELEGEVVRLANRVKELEAQLAAAQAEAEKTNGKAAEVVANGKAPAQART